MPRNHALFRKVQSEAHRRENQGAQTGHPRRNPGVATGLEVPRVRASGELRAGKRLVAEPEETTRWLRVSEREDDVLFDVEGRRELGSRKHVRINRTNVLIMI